MGLVPPGTKIGVFSKVVLFNIVFFNVASTKSSNIAGILSFGGLLGLIRKRLVEFRLDFLAFPSLVDIPPVFGLCSRRARPCCFWFFGYRKWPPSVSWVPQQFLMPAAPCSVWWIRPNNSYYKLTSLFHQDGKGSVSWWLNSYKCKQMINISVVIMKASSHETSHEIYEFRIHSTVQQYF